MTTRPTWAAAPMALLGALVFIAACGGTGGEPEAGGTTVTVTEQSGGTPELESRPDVSYSSSCQDDYPLVFQTGDGSEMTHTGYRFVAEVDLYNDGGAPGRVRVKMTWLFFGGGSTSMTKTVEVRAEGHRKVGFVQPSTQAEVSNMLGHQHGDKLCEPHATVLN
jgi:hypothetical protein